MRENGVIEKSPFSRPQDNMQPLCRIERICIAIITVCMKCGNVIEFDEPTIENLQMKVAEKKRFKVVVTHRLELFGYCNKCSK